MSLRFTPTFATGPFNTLLLERAHMEVIMLNRVKLQREPTELEPSNSHSFTQIYSHIHKHNSEHMYSERINFSCEAQNMLVLCFKV